MSDGASPPEAEPHSDRSLPQLLEAYRRGQTEAGNDLFKRYEPWLKLIARWQFQTRFQAKFDPSDIVQQAMAEAVRAFPRFRGQTEAEFAAWLRQILAHVLAHEIRRYRGTQKRDPDRELSLERDLAATSRRLEELLVATGTSPSQKMIRHEDQLFLARILERLPEDYRQVILLRNFEGLSHDQVAQRMNRQPTAVRMLWVRALARLRRELDT